MTRDRSGQAFVPGFLDAVAQTRGIQTEGELPGGGDLFRERASAPANEQRTLAASWRACDEAVRRCGMGWLGRPKHTHRCIGDSQHLEDHWCICGAVRPRSEDVTL